jgi:hypothetical protein
MDSLFRNYLQTQVPAPYWPPLRAHQIPLPAAWIRYMSGAQGAHARVLLESVNGCFLLSSLAAFSRARRAHASLTSELGSFQTFSVLLDVYFEKQVLQ